MCVGLFNELKSKFNRLTEDASCHSCAIHAHNLTFANSVVKFFGEGGVKNKSTLQLIYACWDLEQEFEHQKWKLVWNTVNAETYQNRMTQPVLTRWDHVGQSCSQFTERKDGFERMARFVLQKRVGSFKDEIKKIATDLLDLIMQPELITMSYFIGGLHKAFWNPHCSMLKSP